MKRLALLFMALSLAAWTIRAGAQSGGAYGSREWLTDCGSPNPSTANTRCYQFMRGVIEGVVLAESSHKVKDPLFELTEDLSYSRIVSLARKFVRPHPDAYDGPAAFLIVVVVQEACPPKH
jgi:hypothetical protein